MCHANPTWGAPRIHGELLKLGIAIAEATVGHYMVRRRPPPSQTWRTFLTNHIGQLVSVDFFVVPTLTFRVLFVFVVLAHDRRQILHVNVTGYPTAAWTAQQIRNAFPWDTAPRFLLRDRDGTSGHNFRACLEAMEIDEVLTAPQSPWQNPYVDRLIGSMRRECVDHVIVLNERSLHRILRSYIDYYHLWRTHLSLGKDAPVSRRVEPARCTGRGHGDAARGRPAPQLPSSRGLTTAMDGRRRKTVHAARRPEERPKDASHSSTFTECTAAMLTLPSFAGPTSARSVTRTVRMRFSVGTSVSSERRKPSVCLDARPNTKPKVTVVSMAWFEYLRCRPGFLRVGLGEFQLASLPSVSPSQTVRLPRARRPVSYSRQFRTR